MPYKPLSPLSQVCIKCKFCRRIQCPFYAALNRASLAGFSCPWPILMFVNFLFAVEILYLAATLSTSGVGSTPGNKTKKVGILECVYANVSKILNAGCSTYFSPMISPTKEVKAEATLSGRMAL